MSQHSVVLTINQSTGDSTEALISQRVKRARVLRENKTEQTVPLLATDNVDS